MAELGPTKLEAVQRMMAAAGFGVPSALDTGGASDEAQAERVLDYVTVDEQIKGGMDNVLVGKQFTAADVGGGVYKITFDSDVLKVECVGPGRYTGNISVRNGFAFITTEDTDDFGSAVSIVCNVYEAVPWSQIAPDAKHAIIKRAIQEFVRQKNPDPNKEIILDKEAAESESYRTPPPDRAAPPRSPIPPTFQPRQGS